MMRSRFRILMVHALVLGAVALVATAAPAADRPRKGTASSAAKAAPAPDPAMAEMLKLAAPGAAHEKLKGMEGKWKAVQKSWSAPGEPTVSEGVSENRMVMGGRFLEQRYTATSMGQPYEGYGLTGYDNRKGEYTMFWIDNLATSMMTGGGSLDAASGELTLMSTGEGPDGKPTQFKLVTRMTDANHHVFTMYAVVEGKEQLMMEIAYTRM